MADLFDFADESVIAPGNDQPRNDRMGAEKTGDHFSEDLPDWHEVPQARFLSWPPRMQLAYCAARDIDSARRAYTAEEIDFYLARARSYQELVNGA